jgi:outer membrane lipoprotein-sorting protein
MLKKLLLITAAFLFILCSCGKRDDLYEANKKMSEMKSYSAKAEMMVNGNKGSSSFKFKQFYIEPDRLRIETLEPEFLNGKVLSFNGSKWKVYHPMIKQTFEISNPKDYDEFVYQGILQKSIMIGEDSKYEYSAKNGVDYIKISASMPNGNEYRKNAAIYLSKDDYLPQIMEIYNEKGDLVVQIKYSEFKYNEQIKDELFTLK